MGGLACLVGALLPWAIAACDAERGAGGAASPSSNPPLDIPRLDVADGAAPTTGIHFLRRPPRVGAKATYRVRATSRTTDGVAEYRSDFEVEALAVDAFVPTRLRVHFTQNVDVYHDAPRPTVLDGKTFVVDVEPPYVRSPSGGAATEEESQRVLDVFPDVGVRSRIDEVLPEQPMAIGERRDLVAAAVLRILHPRHWRLERGTASLARVEAGVAHFDVTLAAASEASGNAIDLRGEVAVRLADTKLIGFVLEGPYRAPGDDAGSGELRIERAIHDTN